MANPPEKTATKPKAAAEKKDKPRFSAAIDARRAFEDAQFRYQQAVQEAWHTAQRTIADLQESHAREQQELASDIQQRSLQAHMAFSKSRQESEAEQGFERRFDADRAFAQTHQELQEEAHKRSAEAQQNFVRALQEIAEKAQTENPYRDAYVAYLQAIREAWSTVDVNVIDPASLAAISNSVASVASSANSLIGQAWSSR